MSIIFQNPLINERAISLMDEINQILDVIENIDDLMPSSSLEQKAKVDPIMKEKFYEISGNSFRFLDERVGRFKEEMNFIKNQVGDSDTNYRSIADAIVITICKILQFQYGKVSWFVNQKKFWLDKEQVALNSELLYNTKRFLYQLTEFDTTNVGRNEVIKTDKAVISLDKRLNPKSFIPLFLRNFQ